MSAAAIAQLFPIFYMPTEDPDFGKYMWLKDAKIKEPQKPQILIEQKDEKNKQNTYRNTPVTIPTVGVEPAKRNIVDKERRNIPNRNTAVCRTVAKPYQSLLSLIANDISPIGNINDEVKERHKIAIFFGESKQNRALLKTSSCMRITLKEMDEIISDIMTVSLTDNSRKGEGVTSCFGRVFLNLGILVAYAQYYKKAIVLLHPTRRTCLVYGKEFLQENVCYISFDPVANSFGPFLVDSVDSFLVDSFLVDSFLVDSFLVDSFLELVHWQKPLKAISNYTLSELMADCEKVGIELLPLVKYKKAVLYTMLENHCYGL